MHMQRFCKDYEVDGSQNQSFRYQFLKKKAQTKELELTLCGMLHSDSDGWVVAAVTAIQYAINRDP